MSDKKLGEGQQQWEEYERPRLTVLGNARELLAGGQGSVVDTIDSELTQPTG
jgi:hypothetical protein